MKKTISVLFVLIYSLLSSASWSDSIDDLTLRNGVFYKRYTDVPFSGSITGKINARLENGKFEGHFDGYYDDGQLKVKGSYKSGKRTGLWEEFSKGGETLETTAWMNDSFITRTGALSPLEKVQLLYKVETRDLQLTLKAVLEKQAKDKGIISQQLVKVKRQEILLSEAKVKLQGEKEINIESRLLVVSLNQQLAEVRGQLGQLQSLLDASEAKDASEDVEIKNLSSKLNAALARVVSEQRKNSRALEAQNTKLKALALERDNALIALKDEKTKLANLLKKENKVLSAAAKLLKERNLLLQRITKERDDALLDLTIEKQLLPKLEKAEILKEHYAMLKVLGERFRSLTKERNDFQEQLTKEKQLLAELKQKESKRLNAEAEILKERNLVLQTITKERNEALKKLIKEKQLLAELKKRDLERLEAEAKELKKYQSKFFVEIEKALGNQGGIKIIGDRFIFSSEILFDKGKADISKEGLNQIKLVSDIITSISKKIPPEINWVLRVDGHTDNVPLSGLGVFKDNWEVSQARALSVVRYMSEELGVPSSRLAATGFGEHHPVDPANTNEARAKNRRIEIKLTER